MTRKSKTSPKAGDSQVGRWKEHVCEGVQTLDTRSVPRQDSQVGRERACEGTQTWEAMPVPREETVKWEGKGLVRVHRHGKQGQSQGRRQSSGKAEAVVLCGCTVMGSKASPKAGDSQVGRQKQWFCEAENCAACLCYVILTLRIICHQQGELTPTVFAKLFAQVPST